MHDTSDTHAPDHHNTSNHSTSNHSTSNHSTSNHNTENPYVGPRPFEEEDSDRFFGREQEIRRLASLVIARRVVVHYARSGAGKTSLLKAGLIPHLRRYKNIRVLPIARVGGESPEGIGIETVTNVYGLNALFDLCGDDMAPQELASLTLSQGLQRLTDASQRPCLLILDQFEELFQLHPEYHAQREDFFRELQRSLHALPQLSLLLSLREDSIADLDPYAALLPDRLRARFRLELLGEEEARRAMQLPARGVGGDPSDVAAQQLVDELRTVQVLGSDGRVRQVLGPWVEPVHLQVVCQRLWSRRGADAGKHCIETGDLRAAGSVDDALTAYYAEQVAAVAAATGQNERILRDWIEHSLLTEQGLRGQVLREAESSQGLANAKIDKLVDARLVRMEQRRGAAWFELAHDRLVQPVRSSNKAWRRTFLRAVQRRAQIWVREHRPRGLLLRGTELHRELAWARTHSEELSADEKQFLAASCQDRRVRFLGGLVLAVVLALAGSLGLFQQEREHRRQELARGLAAQATSHLDERLGLALLLSLEAYRIDPSSTALRGSLLAGLQQQPRLRSFLHGHTAIVWTVAFSPQPRDGRPLLASGGLDHRILLWDPEMRARFGEPLEGHTDGILSLAWDPEGQKLLSTGRDGRMILWDLTDEVPQRRILSEGRVVTSAAFQRRNQLVTGDTDHQILVWDLGQDPPTGRPVGNHTGWVTSLALDPNSRRLASGGADHRILVWPDGVTEPREVPRELFAHRDWVSGLAWSPDGRILASAALDHTVRRFNMETFEELLSPPLQGPTHRISNLAIRPDGKVLVAATANGLLYLWNLETGLPLGPPLAGDLALMRGLAWSPDGRTLATGNGVAVALWDLENLNKIPGLGRPLRGPFGGARDEAQDGAPFDDPGHLRRVAFDPEGTLIVSVRGETPEIRFVDPATGEPRRAPLPTLPALSHAFAISPDGQTVAEFSDDGDFKEVRLWDLPKLEYSVEIREMLPSSVGQDPDRRALARVGNFARILEKTLEPRRTEDCVPVRTVAFTPDGRVLAAEGAPMPSAGDWVERWDVAQGASTRREIKGTKCIRSLAFQGDGELLAVGVDAGEIVLLTSTALQPGSTLKGHLLPVRSLAISPAGEFLASGGDEGIVRLWKLSKRAPHGRPLTGHTDTIHALAFDPTGRILASTGRDRTVILWDVQSGTPLGRPLRGHSAPVWSLDFDARGERLVSGGEDGAQIWELGFEAWKERACRIANRDLTDEEWNLFVGSRIPRDEVGCGLNHEPFRLR